MLRHVLAFFVALSFTLAAFAQPHSLLYEVSGNGLKKSSYLFGTFHLLTESFVDSQKLVVKKLTACDAVAGEVVTDSLTEGSLNLLAKIKADTPLSKLLSATAYAKLNAWSFELLGMDLMFFEHYPPALVNATMTQMLYAKNFGGNESGKPMDVYFQDRARKHKKKVIGLESVQTQINALFDEPLTRQAAALEKFVNEKDSAVAQMQQLISLYRCADYDKLESMMYDEDGYTPEEIKTLVTDRNAAWLRELPKIMLEQPTFVAVGALHLAGENGLVAGLQKQGYTLTPLPLR